MSMTLELLPCPFCGNSDRVHVREQIGDTWFHAECANCDSMTTHSRDKAKAIAAWNRRAHLTQPAQSVDVARMFHEEYERLAPSFGYETRPETREFDPDSPNGRLMIAVCRKLTAALQEKGNE